MEAHMSGSIVLTEKQILSNAELYKNLVDNIENEERKKQLQNVIIGLGDNLFTSPCNTQDGKPGAYVGGLVIHSLQVTKNLTDICKLWAPEINRDTILLCGMFHDIGMVSTTKNEEVFLLETDNYRQKRGNIFNLNPDIRDGLHYAQRSVRLLSYYKVDITDEEYLAILSHHGLFVDENVGFKYKFNKLSYLLHWSDIKTSNFDMR